MAGVSNASMVPQDGLLASPKASPGADPGFALLVDTQWSQLQGFVAGALGVPIDATTFDARYGSFAKLADVLACVDALKDIKALGTRFGDPSRFEASILAGEFDAGKAKPGYVFGEIIWVANRIAGAADTFRSMCDTIPLVFAQVKSPSDRRAVVRDMLLGKDGLHELAEAMAKVVDELRTQTLSPFIHDLATTKSKVDSYASASADIYQQAMSDLGAAGDLVESTTAELNREREKYTNWSGAAGGVAGGLMVLSGGTLWPVALAWGLVAGLWPAEDARKAALAQEKVLADQQDIQAKRALLVADLGSLNSYVPNVVTSLQAIDDALGKISGVWQQQQQALTDIVNATPLSSQGAVAGLDDASKWIAQRGITDAALAWKQVGERTRAFTSQAFMRSYKQ